MKNTLHTLSHLLLSLTILLFCTALAGCQRNDHVPDPPFPPPEETLDLSNITYETSTVLYNETIGKHGLQFRKDLEVTVVEDITFGFEKGISASERLDCIRATCSLRRKIGSKNALTVYIYQSSTYRGTLLSDHILYTHSRNYQSVDYVVDIVLGVFGEYTHYGTAYGYASYLLGQSADTAPTLPEDWPYYDLHYLCFHENFASAEDIRRTENTAVHFVQQYISEYGIEKLEALLSQSGKHESSTSLSIALSQYYANRSIHFTPSPILYKNGGQECLYSASSPHAVFCIPKDWDDGLNDLYPGVYDGYLTKDYQKADTFFRTNAEQMRKYREFFALDHYDDNVYILFENVENSNSGTTSYYQSLGDGRHLIILKGISSLTHEYIHALTVSALSKGEMQEFWAGEGLAKYYASKFDAYGNAMLYEDYANHEYGKAYSAAIGRPIDLSIDSGTLYDMMAYLPGRPLTPNNSYASAASFIKYLTTTFGEREALDYLLIHYDLSRLTNKPLDEIVEDWKQYLETTYASFKNK